MSVLAFYRAATLAAGPVIRLYLAHRARHGKECPDRRGERLGLASRPRPEGPLVWIHAASVGEALSMLALVERLTAERPGLSILFTTGTLSSARLLAERLPAAAIHQFVPVDHALWVERFLDHWRPDLVLWVESEFWPNLLGAIGRRAIPAALVNARISPASYRRWRRWPKTIARLLSVFTLCLGQTEADAARAARLGAARTSAPGNLKYAAAALPVDEGALADLRTQIGERRLWLAASTHAGEETLVAGAHDAARTRHADLLTIIVPRHPARGAAIKAALAAAGHRVALRSAGEKIARHCDIYIADTLGELGLFFRLARIAFIGGSLVDHGGQNPIEAAKLGCAIIHGPHMFNFTPIVAALAAADAAIAVDDGAALADAVAGLLDDEDARAAQAAAALRVADANDAIGDAVLDALAPLLDALARRTPSPRHARA